MEYEILKRAKLHNTSPLVNLISIDTINIIGEFLKRDYLIESLYKMGNCGIHIGKIMNEDKINYIDAIRKIKYDELLKYSICSLLNIIQAGEENDYNNDREICGCLYINDKKSIMVEREDLIYLKDLISSKNNFKIIEVVYEFYGYDITLFLKDIVDNVICNECVFCDEKNLINIVKCEIKRIIREDDY